MQCSQSASCELEDPKTEDQGSRHVEVGMESELFNPFSPTYHLGRHIWFWVNGKGRPCKAKLEDHR